MLNFDHSSILELSSHIRKVGIRSLNMQALAVKTGSYSRLTARCECHMSSQMTS